MPEVVPVLSRPTRASRRTKAAPEQPVQEASTAQLLPQPAVPVRASSRRRAAATAALPEQPGPATTSLPAEPEPAAGDIKPKKKGRGRPAKRKQTAETDPLAPQEAAKPARPQRARRGKAQVEPAEEGMQPLPMADPTPETLPEEAMDVAVESERQMDQTMELPVVMQTSASPPISVEPKEEMMAEARASTAEDAAPIEKQKSPEAPTDGNEWSLQPSVGPMRSEQDVEMAGDSKDTEIPAVTKAEESSLLHTAMDEASEPNEYKVDAEPLAAQAVHGQSQGNEGQRPASGLDDAVAQQAGEMEDIVEESAPENEGVPEEPLSRAFLEPLVSEPEAPQPSEGVANRLAANLVSTIRSFLPSTKPQQASSSAQKKAPKVKALEAAEVAKRREEEKAAERIRQRQDAERARQERVKAKAAAEAEEAKKREEARIRREQEAAQRKRERDEAERKEREEKARRLEEARQKRREQEAALVATNAAASTGANAARSGGAENRPPVNTNVLPAQTTSAAHSLVEAKQRLAKIQQQAALMQQQTAGHSNLQASRILPPDAPRGNVSSLASTSQTSSAPPQILEGNAPQSYEISPYKSDFESEDEEPKKPVPEWARGRALTAQLVAQMYVDPDEVFQQHAKTCSLDEVFALGPADGRIGKHDFNRRSSSGNWFEDRVTWKEEMGYKKAMGYI